MILLQIQDTLKVCELDILLHLVNSKSISIQQRVHVNINKNSGKDGPHSGEGTILIKQSL